MEYAATQSVKLGDHSFLHSGVTGMAASPATSSPAANARRCKVLRPPENLSDLMISPANTPSMAVADEKKFA